MSFYILEKRLLRNMYDSKVLHRFPEYRQAAESPAALPRLFTALKVWECRPQSHAPAHYLLSSLYSIPLQGRKEDFRLATERQLLRKIKETVEIRLPLRYRKQHKGTKTANSSPKSLSRQTCNFRASPPLRLLRPAHPFKIRTFQPLFSARNSLSSTPSGHYRYRRESQRDVGTCCEAVEPMAGWTDDPSTSPKEGSRTQATTL